MPIYNFLPLTMSDVKKNEASNEALRRAGVPALMHHETMHAKLLSSSKTVGQLAGALRYIVKHGVTGKKAAEIATKALKEAGL